MTDDELKAIQSWLPRYRGEDNDFPFPDWCQALLKKAVEHILLLLSENAGLQKECQTLKECILRQAELTGYEGVFRD